MFLYAKQKIFLNVLYKSYDFLGGSDSKASAYNAGDPGSLQNSKKFKE